MGLFDKLGASITRSRGKSLLAKWRKNTGFSGHRDVVVKRHADEGDIYVDLYWYICDAKTGKQIDMIYQRTSWERLSYMIDHVEQITIASMLKKL